MTRTAEVAAGRYGCEPGLRMLPAPCHGTPESSPSYTVTLSLPVCRAAGCNHRHVGFHEQHCSSLFDDSALVQGRHRQQLQGALNSG